MIAPLSDVPPSPFFLFFRSLLFLRSTHTAFIPENN